MKTINSNKEFNDLVATGKPIMLDFYADWCGPCQQLLPTVEKLAKEFEGQVEIVKINVDEQRDIASKFQVRSIPSLFFMVGNKVKSSHLGMASDVTLRKKIQTLLN
ncbi:thioredoxin [Portibacter marinus]|uniref:thioredoxin n=1 Tax=Portibacter marinus TaxID=2898660 RepID=UPI001F004332|nr:thioredoxin [Portibacter marinus]